MSRQTRPVRDGRAIAYLLLVTLLACARPEAPVVPIDAPQRGGVAGRVDLAGSVGGGLDALRSPAGGIGAVLVYLEPSEASLAGSGPDTPREIGIEGGRLVPPLVLVAPDQPFRFVNLDAIHHELFSLGAPNDFRVRIGGRAPSAPVQLPREGFVRAFCGLHPDETYSLIVSPAVHVVEAARDGRFSIAGVQSGDYRIRAVGIDAESEAAPVRVAVGETLEIQLELSPRDAE